MNPARQAPVTVGGRLRTPPRPGRGFWRDEAGTGLREYAAAVILAAASVVVGLTLLATPLYHLYVRLFGP